MVLRPVELDAVVQGVVTAAAAMAQRERGVKVAHAEPLPSLVALADRAISLLPEGVGT